MCFLLLCLYPRENQFSEHLLYAKPSAGMLQICPILTEPWETGDYYHAHFTGWEYWAHQGKGLARTAGEQCSLGQGPLVPRHKLPPRLGCGQPTKWEGGVGPPGSAPGTYGDGFGSLPSPTLPLVAWP